MLGQTLIAALVFATISYINFFVLSGSFFTVFIGIGAAIIALFAFAVSIMLLFAKPQETEGAGSTEQTPSDTGNNA